MEAEEISRRGTDEVPSTEYPGRGDDTEGSKRRGAAGIYMGNRCMGNLINAKKASLPSFGD